MRTQPSERKHRPNTNILQTIIILIISTMVPALAMAAEPPEQNPIHISADRLISDGTNNNAEFIGKVKVVQGQTVIISDRLKLYYRDGEKPQGGINTGDIETLEAMGNVRIEFDNRVAVGEKAVYTTKERKLVLTGPGAKITEGPDKVEGDTIVFYRDDGRIDINGDVKMQIRSNQRGLN